MVRSTGKRGGAVELSATSTTLTHIEIEDGHLEVKSTVPNVLPRDTESDIVDLFDIGADTEKGRINETKPFRHRVHFYGPHGKKVRVWANIDDGGRGNEGSDVFYYV